MVHQCGLCGGFLGVKGGGDTAEGGWSTSRVLNMLSGTLRKGQESSPLFLSYHLKGTKKKMGLVGHNTPISKLVFILLIIYVF